MLAPWWGAGVLLLPAIWRHPCTGVSSINTTYCITYDARLSMLCCGGARVQWQAHASASFYAVEDSHSFPGE